ncbi:MAG TPA: hypothetical protein PKE12_13635 [Kiritimatiellia bacterium]|nr:hypothetical protein [Kiritimatiellia bacterium]
MRYGVRLLLLWVLVLASFAARGEVESDDGMRTWTSVGGARLEAAFIEVKEGGEVVLERAGGRQLSIRLDQLVEADRAYVADRVAEVEAEVEAGGGAPGDDKANPLLPVRGGWLPVFASGPYAGHFAVYDSPLYQFIVTSVGGGVMRMKDSEGRFVGPPLPVRPWRSHYFAPDTRPGRTNEMKSFAREVKSLTGPALQPVMNPSVLEITGLYNDGVAFTQRYEFAREAVRRTFSIRDPPRVQYATRGGECGMGRYVATDQITGQTLLEDQKKFFAGWSMTLRPAAKSGRPKVLTFWESLPKRVGQFETAEIRGPWGERTVSLTFRGAPARITVYTGRSLWEGYNMGFSWLWDDVRRVGMDLTVR